MSATISKSKQPGSGKTMPEWNVVTGAFGYAGKYIARRLLSLGRRVRTLTGHPDRPNSFGGKVEVAPLDFEEPDELARSLEGATTLYNTYWVRFPFGRVTFQKAIENSKKLIEAAEEAGVRKIVHISVTNARQDSPLPYFAGKGALEAAVMRSKLSYRIIRPTLIFGLEDILVNNIAWLLRRFPVFAIPGVGDYRLQPVFVEDVAEISVDAADREDNVALDATGPETFPFDEMVGLIASAVQSKARIIHVRPGLALLLSRLVGKLTGDVVITQEEIKGLMGNLLVSEKPPTGRTRLSDWLRQNANTIGVTYASELTRHYR